MNEEELTTPIKHDGWLSRTYVSCAVAFLLLVGLLTFLFAKMDKLSESNFLYGLLGCVALLLIGLGLVKADKVLELVKLRMMGPKKP